MSSMAKTAAAERTFFEDVRIAIAARSASRLGGPPRTMTRRMDAGQLKHWRA